jgi:hypothetical protein
MASNPYVTPGTEVSVGRIFSRAFGVIGNNPATMFGVAFLFQALPSMVMSALRVSMQSSVLTREGALGLGALSIASGLVSLILAMLVQGALVRATVAYAEGRRASFGESVAAGLRVALPLVGLAIIEGIATMIGTMLFLVPGMILFVMWAVASPALVEEGVGIGGALGRSRALTKNVRWKVFGIELIVLVVLWMVSAIFGLLMLSSFGLNNLQAMSRGSLPIGWLVGNVVLTTLLGALWSAVQTSLYVELRNWKDGPSSQGLATIFA